MEVSELIQQADIVDYISQYCALTERSDGEWWGLSPLKSENTPSFSVNREEQVFYDFSSGQGGDVLAFIRAYNHCSFPCAVSALKQYLGIPDGAAASPGARKRLLATSIAKRFRDHPKKPKEAKPVSFAQDCMERFPRDRGKLQVWLDEGISHQSLEKFQVRYDPLSDRLVFPIRAPSGEIINICGRTLDPRFKEKKLRKYTYFQSMGTLDTIYGLWENRDAIASRKEIVLFEGAKSVMKADTWGIPNTGAILTSHLNPNQFKILIRLGVRVVFALDAEVDIRQDKHIRKLLPYVRVEWVQNRDGLLEDKDAPVDKGESVFRKLYKERSVVR